MGWLVFLGPLLMGTFGGIWVAVVLGLTAFLVYQIVGHGFGFMMGSAIWSSLDMYALTSLPLFILMGEIVIASGVSKKFFDNLTPLFSRIPGELLVLNIALTALFSAVFGVSTACVAVVGSITIPELLRRGYEPKMVLGTVAAGGSLGIIVPPSASYIMYGALTSTSVGNLFIAGIIPGILIAALFIVYIVIECKRHPSIVPAAHTGIKTSLRTDLIRSLNAYPLLLMIVSVLIPIIAGWCTPTESSAIGVAASIIFGIIFGKLSLSAVIQTIRGTARLTSMLLFIVMFALVTASAISLVGLPYSLIQIVGGSGLSSHVVMVLFSVAYLFFGTLLDGISIMMMTIPLVSPVVSSMGFDLIWFGIVFTMFMSIGQITPPFGVNLFVVRAVAREKADQEVTIMDAALGSLPFVICYLIVATLCFVFPKIVLLLVGT